MLSISATGDAPGPMAVDIQLNSAARVLFVESELRRLRDLRDAHPLGDEQRKRLDAEIKLAEVTLSHCRATVELERSVGQIEVQHRDVTPAD